MDLKVLKRNIIYTGKVFTTIVDDVEYPSGNRSIREVAKHPGGAAALALFPDHRIIMIKQHRYPFDKFIWELPAGKLEPSETPLHCAQRELEEETGFRAASWELLSSIYTTPGFCDETLHLYLAAGLEALPGGRRLEEGEQSMLLEILPLEKILTMIDDRQIVDAKTICAVLIVDRLLRLGNEK
jgi:ADP-ribose pyrophosphatase